MGMYNIGMWLFERSVGLAALRNKKAKLWKEQVTEGIKAAEAAGAKFNEVDTDAFTAAIAPLTEKKLTNDVTKTIYDQVRAAAK